MDGIAIASIYILDGHERYTEIMINIMKKMLKLFVFLI